MPRKQYSKELKLELVKKHLEDRISYWKLGKEYGIEASIIRRWGYKYETFGEDGLEKQNADLCNYSAEYGVRKNTTLEERISIAEECINTGCDYASVANKYGCSYGQVYAWLWRLMHALWPWQAVLAGIFNSIRTRLRIYICFTMDKFGNNPPQIKIERQMMMQNKFA